MDKGLTIDQFMGILDKKKQLYKDVSYQLFRKFIDDNTPQNDRISIIAQQKLLEVKMETIDEIETALFDTIDGFERN